MENNLRILDLNVRTAYPYLDVIGVLIVDHPHYIRPGIYPSERHPEFRFGWT